MDVDIVNSDVLGAQASDLLRDDLWHRLFERVLADEFDFVWMGTPCNTFSRAREKPPGPRPLRSVEKPMGLSPSELTDRELQQLKEGNFFALKSAEMAKLCWKHNVGWAIENPAPFAGHVSLFYIDALTEVAALSGVSFVEFDQCMYMGETTKPTRVLFFGVDFSGLRVTCNHPKRWWYYTDPRGNERRTWSAHPPLAGRQREGGEFATKQAAAYPGRLNVEIVKRIISRGRAVLPSQTGGTKFE